MRLALVAVAAGCLAPVSQAHSRCAFHSPSVRTLSASGRSINTITRVAVAMTSMTKAALAVENYRRSLALDSTNVNAVEWLKKLRAPVKP